MDKEKRNVVKKVHIPWLPIIALVASITALVINILRVLQ